MSKFSYAAKSLKKSIRLDTKMLKEWVAAYHEQSNEKNWHFINSSSRKDFKAIIRHQDRVRMRYYKNIKSIREKLENSILALKKINMASISNAVAQFSKKNLNQNGIVGVAAVKDGNEDCIKVTVQKTKHPPNLPKVFLGHRLIVVSDVNKA